MIRETYGSTTMDFLYDASGRPYAFYYNGTLYYYVLNLQGDVIQLLDSSGNLIANYSYDAWGKVTVSDIASGYSTVANANPLRYRSYYYDSETGFYYLQSRYYDPAICRFINPDAFASTGQGMLGYNMFAYCNNDPVNCSDDSGFDLMYRTRVAISDCHGTGSGSFTSGVVVTPNIGEILLEVGQVILEKAAAIGSGAAAVYAYVKSIRAEIGDPSSNSYPNVHHIVPYGKFTNRREDVQTKLNMAQNKMEHFGVIPKTDAMNLVPVSQRYHRTMHTNGYILWVSNCIIKAPDSKEGIIGTLHHLRLVICMNDIFTGGYY